jgi:hypothetical protein
MKSASMTHKSFSIALLVTALIVLPGCAPLDWVKKQFGGGETVVTETGDTSTGSAPNASNKDAAACEMDNNVLVTMDGKPVVTLDMLEQNYRQVLEERPDLEKIAGVVKESLLQGLVRQAIVDQYVQENKVEENPAYKKDREVMAETCRKILNVKYFKEAHPVTVKESEVKEYYESNKDTFPDLIIERGGVETMVVAFDKEADAKAFLVKAKAAPKDFEKLAKENGHKDKFRDFKFVNARSPEVDPAIKNAILDAKTPDTKIVHACNKYWVVNLVSKKESKYRPFDEQVKEGLRQYMIQDREAKVMDEEMAKLKEKYKVIVNPAAVMQSAQAQFNFEDALGMLGGEQMAEADLEDAGEAANQVAQVA